MRTSGCVFVSHWARNKSDRPAAAARRYFFTGA
jgi:hypothetical protein